MTQKNSLLNKKIIKKIETYLNNEVCMVILTGSYANDNYVLGWSDVDLWFILENFKFESINKIRIIEKELSIEMNTKVGINILEKNLLEKFILNRETYTCNLKLSRILMNNYEKSVIVYKKEDYFKNKIKIEDFYFINPINSINYITNSVDKFLKNNNDYKSIVRKLYKNCILLFELYHLSCNGKYINNEKELIASFGENKFAILDEIYNSKKQWVNLELDYQEYIKKLFSIFNFLIKKILSSYKNL